MEPAELVPLPAIGRTFTGPRQVRIADCDTSERCRLDALACYLQDVSDDDFFDAGFGAGDAVWVTRRLVLQVRRWPRFRERLALTTWCAGVAPRWAERRVTIRSAGALGDGRSFDADALSRLAHGDGLPDIDAAVLWVHLDTAGTLARIPESFVAVYGPAAGGRTVRAKLRLDPVAPPDVVRRPWPLRVSDFDALRHVNNAAYLAPIEEVLTASCGDGAMPSPVVVEVEYRRAIEPGDAVEIAFTGSVSGGPDGLGIWLLPAAGGDPFAVARVRAG